MNADWFWLVLGAAIFIIPYVALVCRELFTVPKEPDADEDPDSEYIDKDKQVPNK